MIKRQKPKSNKKSHSSYWLGGWGKTSGLDTLSTAERETHDLYQLSSAKRAISNFVTIVTNKTIPVTFNTAGESYTDGKQVVIGTEVANPDSFDVVVGLALHEGSHIKLSDFNIIKNIETSTPDHVIKKAMELGIKNWPAVIKDILNVVEDRRIDFYIFNEAPGYRNYYRSMYNKFFNSPVIDKGLLSDYKTEETTDSYMYRIINIHNKHTRLDALKGLRKIFNLINLKKIDRLETTYDAMAVANDVFDVMLENIDKDANEKAEQEKADKADKDGNGGDPQEMTDEEFQKALDNMDGEVKSGQGSGGTPVKLTDKQKKMLDDKIQEQKDFMNGKVDKKILSEEDGQNLDNIEAAGTELRNVGGDVNRKAGHGSYKGINVVVVKKMTRELMESKIFPMSSTYYNGTMTDENGYSVQKGIKLGTILGKKMQVRSEERTTIYNRQKLGRIDKRMIASLGYGNESAFTFLETDQYKKANLHVSIDASGSMHGTKWDETIVNVVALCKAVDMISNLEIQVTFRTTNNSLPYVVLAYDSRVDKFAKVKQLFPFLSAGGYTPEGLCYEAIMKDFLEASATTDSYFLNISDGDPYFSGSGFSYSGSKAAEHTRKMVKMIEAAGIKTLAYFVSDGYQSSKSNFQRMYGKGAKTIDVTSVSQITKTMNELFLKK